MVGPSFLHPGAFNQPMREMRVGETIKVSLIMAPKRLKLHLNSFTLQTGESD